MCDIAVHSIVVLNSEGNVNNKPSLPLTQTAMSYNLDPYCKSGDSHSLKTQQHRSNTKPLLIMLHLFDINLSM